MIWHFNIWNILRIKLESENRPEYLLNLLRPHICNNLIECDLSIHLTSNRTETVKKFKERVDGRYKGCSWNISYSKTNDDSMEVAFYSFFFQELLALHLVIVPLLKKHLVLLKGGVSISASVIRNGSQAIVFLGMPGTGKTKMALNAIQKGCSLVADNEIAFLSDGKIVGLFDELEIRWGTIRNTMFWSNLSTRNKITALIHSLISILSIRKIGLNISIRPAEIGVIGEMSIKPESIMICVLNNDNNNGSISINQLESIFVSYEQWYRNIYIDWMQGVLNDDLPALALNCRRVLNQTIARYIPVNTDIEHILKFASLKGVPD